MNTYPTNRVDAPANRTDAPTNRMDPSTRTDAPMPTPQPKAEQPKLEPLNATPSNTVQPRPWESGYTPTILPPASPRTEITAPPGLPNDTSRPTRELEDNSQKRVSDSEALNWLHGKYQHLTIEQKQQNDRDAQKAYDNTPSSWNPFASLSWEDRASAAKQQKMLEFSQGFRTDLNNLIETSNQPHSFDSDMARQSLITIIKRSAENMSDEAGNREISEECCAQVKELCKANANGRKEMVDAVRIGLTESSHLPSGAINYLMDGLVLLATDKPPVITADAAGRLTLLALKHELDNTPRLGAPDQRGETRDEVTRRQVRLIQMLDQFGYKNALGDLQDIVKSSADDQIREAAAKAIQDLRRAA